MRLSVVINTYNRGRSLRNTLRALRYQTYNDFEVVVVNGPSKDETAVVLAEFDGQIRNYRCPDVHLSKSRNIGIDHAAGEIVAFIDDDAIPEPDWISDLIAAYDSPNIGGAGGLVYDHTGTSYQYEYSVCNRVARASFDRTPPFDDYNTPGADPFLYLQGTNCSFRRNALIEIGGFDEEIEYYLDETEVCMQIIDRGYQLRPLTRAIVHHKYLSSHIRNQHKVVLDPYSTVKNHCCFAVRNGTRTRPISEVLDEVNHYVNMVKAGGRGNHEFGRMTDDQLAYFLRRVEQAVETGVRKGLTSPRQYRHIAPARSTQFLPFPTITPEGKRLKICFVSREFPPQEMGGIGRFTSDLATGCARAGHEVHVITHSPNQMHTVDFEDGLWMHRLPGVAPKTEPLRSMQLACNYLHAANIYHELEHIHRNRGLDIVSAPIWLCEGVISSLDDRWPTVLSLVTTLKTIQGMGGTSGDSLHTQQMIALESATIQKSDYIHAVSRAMAKKCRDEAGSHSAMEFVVPLGTSDVRDRYPRSRPQDGRVRILFVGRLEPRKGVDVLLDAVYQVLPEFADAELVLAGRENTPAGMEGYESRWKKHLVAHPELNGRIRFTGEISDDDLQQNYADCDIFVLPSRYESFGLVLTEAMMHGKPVIASAAGGMVEIVEDGENGYLFETDNASSLADVMRKLLRSAERREQFGRRSREVYEQKFSTDIMVRNTIATHRKIVEHHRQQAKRKPGTFASRLSVLIHEISSVPMETAILAVRSLLVPRFGNQYTDYAGELTEIWSKNDEEFIRSLYPLLLGRPADGYGLKDYLHQLSGGTPRIRIVEHLAYSEEARNRKIATDWLDTFVIPETTPVASISVSIVAPRSTIQGKVKRIAGGARRKIMRVPGVGKGLKLLKHLAKLPITVRNISTQTQHVNAIVSDLHSRLSDGDVASTMQRLEAMQKQLAEELLAMRNRSSSTDRQLRWQLGAQSAKIEQLLAEIARVRGTSAAA